MIISRSHIDLLEMLLTAFKNGEEITVVPDPWLSSAEALRTLNLRTADYLKWLTDNGHILRRQRDGRSFEYEPKSVKAASEGIKNRTIILPRMS